MNKITAWPFLSLLILLSFPLSGQKLDDVYVRDLIQKYKADLRGPYKDIRWFCPDGSVQPPKEPCEQPGGVQRARYRDEVTALGKAHHLFLGQILSTTPYEDFWDANHYHARLKQYQLEKYLRAVDDGWILRRARYYRGAIQDEDEENWGLAFFQWLLSDTLVLQQHFYLVREAVRDIPHQGDNSRMQKIRAVSKAISDVYPAFMDLRVKIHGQPDAGDIQLVQRFRQNHRSRLSAELNGQFDELLTDMQAAYQSVSLSSLQKYLKRLPKDAEITHAISELITLYANVPAGRDKSAAMAEVIWLIRTHITEVSNPRARLDLLDLSLQLEDIILKENVSWTAASLESLMDKVCHLGLASAGAGAIEKWEWNVLEEDIHQPEGDAIRLETLSQFLTKGRSLVEWGSAMPRAIYKDVIELYQSFEPLTNGFFDDRVRSSVLLPLGQEIGRLGDLIAREAGLSNQVLNIANQSHIRGVNPGFALGELVIVPESSTEIEVQKDKIYAFLRPPADLKPVAGIATVTEGNMVSHVQLLARNLGIPNAVISAQNLEALKAYAGRRVFYAVSNQGTVLMKPAEEMTGEEKQLFTVKKRSEEKIRVPVEKIKLDQKEVIDLRTIDARASGKLCGPKAANLGQLKKMFPEQVVEGLVIPFGIFRQHMDQPMPGHSSTYWDFLNQTFETARTRQAAGQSETEVEKFTLEQLALLRSAIKEVPLSPDFVTDLERGFQKVLGKSIGQVPVFLRSDTNMEDLKDFTGAGLNLTIFNVVERDRILQGIKDVWASPYTERSFKWRQSYLLNPENVFPSILIIPSVDVDYSGVMITKGIGSNESDDLTIAFSRGAGGAVDGQAAESYLLEANGKNELLSPAREPFFNRLPDSGGTLRKTATFEQPILNGANVITLRQFAEQVKEKLPGAPGIESKGPFDVELGFLDNQLWLFQVRPFVENKNALASTYLQSITPEIPKNKLIQLNSLL